MKAEDTTVAPVVDLRAPDGVQSQGDSRFITAVLLSDGSGDWIKIQKGSFHYYVTGDPAQGQRAVPYIEFVGWIGVDGLTGWRKVQCFPAACAAFVYEDEADQ